MSGLAKKIQASLLLLYIYSKKGSRQAQQKIMWQEGWHSLQNLCHKWLLCDTSLKHRSVTQLVHSVTTFVIKKDGTQSLGRRNPKDRLWGHRQNHMSGKKAIIFIYIFDCEFSIWGHRNIQIQFSYAISDLILETTYCWFLRL